MALKFGESAGGAQKNRADSIEIKNGENKFRMVGDLLARYVYWVKGTNDKNIPVECLAFNRESEKFDNAEKDWVPEYYPDLKCGWAYCIQAIDPADGKVKIWNLKKKMTEHVLDLAKDPTLGDPTDPETGWDVVFTKKKTGPLPINVSYTVSERQLKQRPLTDEEREAIMDLKSMDEVLSRPTPDQVKQLLDKLRQGSTENLDEDVGEELEVK